MSATQIAVVDAAAAAMALLAVKALEDQKVTMNHPRATTKTIGLSESEHSSPLYGLRCS